MSGGAKNGPGVVSAQTTLMLPAESRAICGSNDEPVLLERFVGVEKVVPPSVERLRKISALPGLLSAQATLMLPFESKAICGWPDFVSLERFLGTENVPPPSLERLKKVSIIPGPKPRQITLMFPLESMATCGTPEQVPQKPV